MKKIIWAYLMQLPLWVIIISSFFASIYASIKKIGGIEYSTSFFILIVIILYISGRVLEKKSKNNNF